MEAPLLRLVRSTSARGGRRRPSALDYYHSCAILDDGTVKCWGSNGYGQLGVGDTTDKASPTAVVATNLGAGVKSVATGYQHTCAVLNDGSLKCWGSAESVSLGYGDNSNIYNNAPPAENVNLGAGLTAKSVSATYGHTCVILNDNTLKCYGYKWGFSARVRRHDSKIDPRRERGRSGFR